MGFGIKGFRYGKAEPLRFLLMRKKEQTLSTRTNKIMCQNVYIKKSFIRSEHLSLRTQDRQRMCFCGKNPFV